MRQEFINTIKHEGLGSLIASDLEFMEVEEIRELLTEILLELVKDKDLKKVSQEMGQQLEVAREEKEND